MKILYQSALLLLTLLLVPISSIAGVFGSPESNNVTIEGAYTGEIFSSLSGGIEQKSVYLDNYDLNITFNMEKLIGLRNTFLFFYIIGNSGDDPSANYVGDLQVASNIETNETWKLYEVWIEHAFLEDRFLVKAGLYDLNSEIDAVDPAGLFINSSHGIGPDFSQSGIMGPSIFSTTSLGVRIRANLSEELVLHTVILDGIPGDPDNPKGTRIKFGKDDGLLIAYELNYFHNFLGNSATGDGKLALGGWFYTSEFEDIEEVNTDGKPAMKNGNYGLFASFEHPVNENIAGFIRTGIANTDFNQLGFYLGAGISTTGLIPGRDQDQIGIAVANAFNGSKYMDVMKADNIDVDSQETNIELIYRMQIFSWMTFQPDFQYIINPGTDSSLDNASVISMRLELSF